MKRIRLENTFFEGLNNAYLFDGDGPTTLVDTGVSTASTREQLTDGLAERGVAIGDVDQILLTHWHADHAGLAGELQAESDATVRVHPEDAPLVAQDHDAQAAVRDQRDRRFAEWGIPEEPRRELVSFLAGDEQLTGDPATVTPIEHGETVSAGAETLAVVHLPGHTAGLCGFVRRTDDGEQLFSGDALLPEYTPNIGGADLRVDRPLERYLDTLAGIVERDYARAHPGHRDPIADPAARAQSIIGHHYERTERVVRSVAELGPADPWTVSADLFGDLENIHILHGPGEAFAHLDHLVAHGIVERTAEGYVLADPDAPLEPLFPNVLGTPSSESEGPSP
jgi:glyoxylase-like metal-dependent hydrolase (beta-lactamase superfamily II)